MKIKDVAKQYGLDADSFTSFCQKQSSIQVTGTFSLQIDDSDVQRAVDLFRQYLQKKEDQRKEAIRKEQERNEALAKMLITSGFSFDGYTITKYSGYISGDDATTVPRTGYSAWTGRLDSKNNNSENLTKALVKIRRQAIKELKEAAYDLGCNAVIGVDFDYITLDPQTANSSGGTTYEDYVICVTANGNAVVIEKN